MSNNESSSSGANSGENSGESPEEKPEQTAKSETIKFQEKNLERMEALLKQSAMGIHILFDNSAIAQVMAKNNDDKDFFDFDKMKCVQDVMTDLISKKTYFEKMSFLRELDKDVYEMLIRTYFHIVENTVRAGNELSH